MKRNNKVLYEQIMRSVAKEVKKALYEARGNSDYNEILNQFKSFIDLGYIQVDKGKRGNIAYISVGDSKHKNHFKQQLQDLCDYRDVDVIRLYKDSDGYNANILYDTDYGWDGKAGIHEHCFTDSYETIDELLDKIDSELWLSDILNDDIVEWMESVNGWDILESKLKTEFTWDIWNNLTSSEKENWVRGIVNTFNDNTYPIDVIMNFLEDWINEDISEDDFN